MHIANLSQLNPSHYRSVRFFGKNKRYMLDAISFRAHYVEILANLLGIIPCFLEHIAKGDGKNERSNQR